MRSISKAAAIAVFSLLLCSSCAASVTNASESALPLSTAASATADTVSPTPNISGEAIFSTATDTSALATTDNTPTSADITASSAEAHSSTAPPATSVTPPATTAISTTVPTTVPAATTTPAPKWTESAASGTMYVNTDGIYSRNKALLGAPTVRRYAFGEAVTVTAVTDTDYFKLNDGSFIHKDYLSKSKPVQTTAATTAATAPAATKAPASTKAPDATKTPSDTKKPDSAEPEKYISSGYKPLDEKIFPILDRLITDKMSDVQKLKAVYQYLTGLKYFERTLLISQNQKQYTEQLYAVWLLDNGYGVCYDFSSAFKYMTRALGFDTQMIYGMHTNPSGGAGEHSWDEINIGGTVYIFDPSIELLMKSEGYYTTDRFMKTYNEIGHFYIK